MNIRAVTLSGLFAALYAVLTLVLAPVSYGPVQFRASEALKPVTLYSPWFALAFGVGNFLANLASPFGAWDFVAMPFVNVAAGLICYNLRRLPWLAVAVQAIVTAAGVAVFPLGMGAGVPFMVAFPMVLTSELIMQLAGYAVLWRRYGPQLLPATVTP